MKSNYTPKKEGKYAIIVPAYNRGFYLETCLEKLVDCRLSDLFDCFVLVDGLNPGEHDKRTIDVCNECAASNNFRSFSIVKREDNFGLTKNILNGLKETIGSGYDMSIVIEDDLICSLDCLEVGVFAFENGFFDKEDIFSMAGSSACDQFFSDGQNSFVEKLWHKSLLVYYPQKVWGYIKDFVSSEYYGIENTRVQEATMKEYLYKKFHKKIVDANIPKVLYDQIISGTVVKYPLQAGLMNCIILSNKMKQLLPKCSRAKHVGAIGWNQVFKTYSQVPPKSKTDIMDNPDSFFHVPGNDSWREDFEWETLRIE